MSAAPTRAALRAELSALADGAPPAPRAFFVAELEHRLAEMMKATADGDLFPDVVVTRVDKARWPRRGVAVALALAVGCMAVGVGALQQTSPRVGLNTRDDRAAAPAAAGARDAVAAGEASDGRRPLSFGAARSGSAGRATTPAPSAGDAVDRETIAVWPEIDQDALAAATSDDPAPIGLRGSGTPAAVFLDWDRYEGSDFAAYLVLRAAAPDVPQHPDASGRTLMVLRVENADHVSHRDTPEVGTTPRYRIVAVNRDGDVIGRSEVFEADVRTATGRISQLPQPPTS